MMQRATRNIYFLQEMQIALPFLPFRQISPLIGWSHGILQCHKACIICLASKITGAVKFKGSKTEAIVDSIPLVVFGLFRFNTLNPNISISMFHLIPRALLIGSLSRSRSRDRVALFSTGISAKTFRSLLKNLVKLKPPLAQSLVKVTVDLQRPNFVKFFSLFLI